MAEGWSYTQPAWRVQQGGARGQGSDSLACRTLSGLAAGAAAFIPPSHYLAAEGVSPPCPPQPCPGSDKKRGHPGKTEVKLWPGASPALDLPARLLAHHGQKISRASSWGPSLPGQLEISCVHVFM